MPQLRDCGHSMLLLLLLLLVNRHMSDSAAAGSPAASSMHPLPLARSKCKSWAQGLAPKTEPPCCAHLQQHHPVPGRWHTPPHRSRTPRPAGLQRRGPQPGPPPGVPACSSGQEVTLQQRVLLACQRTSANTWPEQKRQPGTRRGAHHCCGARCCRAPWQCPWHHTSAACQAPLLQNLRPCSTIASEFVCTCLSWCRKQAAPAAAAVVMLMLQRS